MHSNLMHRCGIFNAGLRRTLRRWNSTAKIDHSLKGFIPSAPELNLRDSILVDANDTKNVVNRVAVIDNELNAERLSLRTPIDNISPETLKGRIPRNQIKLNEEVAKAINNNILSLQIPANIRRSVANYFIHLRKTPIHKPTNTKMEVEAHIAAIFLQNYTSIYQSLSELQKRIGKDNWKPKRILDVGYGPATGIVAFNDLMGPEYRDEKTINKDAVIIGHKEMINRAKIILSRQYNEIPKEVIENMNENNLNKDDVDESQEDFVGEVMAKKIKILTRLKDEIPTSGNYDLIILTHQLLKNEAQFPLQVDRTIEHYLKLLSPKGHLVIVERGNPTGFESIARARQIILRPENYENEYGKIPRPWIRGSSNKPQRNINIDKLFDKDISELEKEDEEYDKASIDYHLKVIAPCSHHKPCPLQVGNPQFYLGKSGKKLKICNFQKNVMRPKYTIEVKKGKVLATPWETPYDGTGKNNIAKAGTGRPNGKNFEIVNYCYLIIERSANDPETIRKINTQREESKKNVQELDNNDPDNWPRIIGPLQKLKGYVAMSVCAPSGDIEKWIVPKSFSKIAYHDARKALKGDLWALGAKTKKKSTYTVTVEKLEAEWKEGLKLRQREKKRKEIEIDSFRKSLEDYNSNDLESNIKLSSMVYGHDFDLDNNRKDHKYHKVNQKNLKN